MGRTALFSIEMYRGPLGQHDTTALIAEFAVAFLAARLKGLALARHCSHCLGNSSYYSAVSTSRANHVAGPHPAYVRAYVQVGLRFLFYRKTRKKRSASDGALSTESARICAPVQLVEEIYIYIYTVPVNKSFRLPTNFGNLVIY